MFQEDERRNTSCNALIKEYFKNGWTPYRIHKKLIYDGKKISQMTVYRKVNKLRTEGGLL
jgi:Fe2+ or Zn2+ uptake regulation protein